MCWLLAALALATLALGRLALPDDRALLWVVRSGYWFMLALALAGGAALVRLWLAGGREWPASWRLWRTWAVIAAATLAWHAHERPGFKILADEVLLLGTSQSLHMQRQAGYAVRATDVRGPFELLQTTLDKRPLFFPFLVSAVHDWTGYRPENIFILNAVLGLAGLLVVHGLATRIARSPAGGHVAVLWLAGIPLWAQQASGGGFELLNVTLLAAWLWLAIAYTARPTAEKQDALVLVAVMVASTRYESLLYLVPTAGLLLWVWSRRGGRLASPLLPLAPVLLLPTLWLNQAFSANAGFWEMQSVGASRPFALGNLPDNLGHALAHFLSTDGFQPNSPAFGVVGLLALPCLAVWGLRLRRDPASRDEGDAGLLAGLAGLLAGTGLMMAYFWGQFDHPVIHRLSLPTQLLMLVAVLLVVARLCAGKVVLWRITGGLALLSLVVWSLPVMARNAYGRGYTPGVAYAWRAEFLERLPGRNILVIDRDCQFWITRGISATPIAQAQARREGIAFHFRNRSFTDIYVFQALKVEPETGVIRVATEDELGSGYVLETVAEHRLAISNLARISRVTAVNPQAVAAPSASADVPAVPTDPKQAEAARKAFLENWIKNLP